MTKIRFRQGMTIGASNGKVRFSGAVTRGTGFVPTPPAGFILLVDRDGAPSLDAGGAYLMEPV